MTDQYSTHVEGATRRGSRRSKAGRADQGARKRPVFRPLGAVEFGKDEDEDVGIYHGTGRLVRYIDVGRQEEKAQAGVQGLAKEEEELTTFRNQYPHKKFVPGVSGRTKLWVASLA
jgi:hypothetical protein